MDLGLVRFPKDVSCFEAQNKITDFVTHREVWRQRGNQGDEWHVAQAPVSSTRNWLLVVTGIVGSGYQGDIAIDDVLISVSISSLAIAIADNIIIEDFLPNSMK